MKKALILAAAALVLASCGVVPKGSDNKIGVVAHRGFWLSEAAMKSQNSIASLTEAQKEGFWGSECDIHITKDGQVVVNHNADFVQKGLFIASNDYSAFEGVKLPNGEGLPLFSSYLEQAKKQPKTFLVVEFKDQKDAERNEALVSEALKLIREAGMYDPSKLGFISFSWDICCRIAKECPKFVNQYLAGPVSGIKSPDKVHEAGINGIDYEFHVLLAHPDWVKEAKNLGMGVNCWTVNAKDDIQKMIDLGVDNITTNYPLVARELLGGRESVR